ncbi:MAG: EF-hand domain-containing protein [Geminicoccaceae bacterium]
MKRSTKLIIATALVGGAAFATVPAIAGGGPRGPGGSGLIKQFDTNDDGKLTQAEIDAARQARLEQFDADKNGALSLEEYQALWLDAMQRAMVRAFQANDADGDGSVTIVEFQARFADIVEDLDRNGDGEITRDELRRRGHEGRRGWGPRGPHGGPSDDE